VKLRIMAACAVLAAVTGCGSGGSDEDRIRDAYDAFYQALAGGDGKRVCELVTAEFRRVAFASRAADCPAIVEKRLRPRPKDASSMSTVQRVTITGDTADVAYGIDGNRDIDRMQMRKVSGDWLLDLNAEDDEPMIFRRERAPIAPSSPAP
jgi:hypothetical protein